MASRTSDYYKKNPKARAKRLKQQARYNRQSLQIEKRVELNRENHKRGTYGNGDGKDVSHSKNGKTKLMIQRKNRAANGHGKRSRYA